MHLQALIYIHMYKIYIYNAYLVLSPMNLLHYLRQRCTGLLAEICGSCRSGTISQKTTVSPVSAMSKKQLVLN